MTLRRQAAPATEGIKAKTFYHGTSSEAAAQKIIHSGIQPRTVTMPDQAKSRSSLAPVPDRVYLTDQIGYAAIYARGGDVFGHESTMSDDAQEPRGYLFEIPGSELQGDITVDEDSIGEFLDAAAAVSGAKERLREADSGDWWSSYGGAPGSPRHLKWKLESDKRTLVGYQGKNPINAPGNERVCSNLLYIARQQLTEKQWANVSSGEIAHQAAIGKKLQKFLPDWMVEWMIHNGGHTAHQGAIHPSRCWRFKKVDAAKVRKEDVLSICEEVPMPAPKLAYTPLKYDPKEYNSLKKVWGDQVINELIAAGKPWDNPIVMKRELEQNFLGTFHSIEEAMADLFDEQLGTPFIKKFRRPGTSEVDWTAVASKVVSPAHGLPGLFVVSIPGAAGDVHVFVRDSRKKRANFWDDEPQAADPENPTPEEEAAWEEWAANRNEYVLHHQAADEAGKEPLDYLDDIVTLVTKNVARYRTTFKKPLGYKEVEKDLVEKLGMDEALASLVSPAVNQRVDTTIDPTMFRANLKKVLTSAKAKNAAAMDYMLDSTQVPQQDPRADKTWDSPYCNNHGNERPTRDAESTTTTAAIEQHKEPKKLPPRDDMRTHLDKEVRDEIADDKAEAKEGSQNTKTQLPTPHVGAGVPTSRLLRRR